jgi:hypothetical protein
MSKSTKIQILAFITILILGALILDKEMFGIFLGIMFAIVIGLMIKYQYGIYKQKKQLKK